MNSSEMRTLGRIGQPLSGGTYRPRRRLRVPRWLAASLVLALVAVIWVGATAGGQVPSPQAASSGIVPQRPAGPETSRGGQRSAPAAVFASVGDLELTLPHARPVTVAFHEATRVEALELAPVGTLVANDNAARFQPPADTEGPQYRVLSSRGRARPATSAVDVVVPLGDDILAPVSGRVIAVTQYPLYGQVRDWRVEIRPQGHPDLTVVVIHLLEPGVTVGDKVAAGRTSLAAARLLPFDSHVDDVTDVKQPHAHIEVKPAVEASPIDPNQAALPADAGDDL